MAPPAPLSFSVRRSQPQFVAPSEPTPREIKHLSDVDLQGANRDLVCGVWIYPANPARRGEDPARVVRHALSRALVYYYPFAGRLREGPGGRLSVECTGEGALFTEADADVGLDQFGGQLHPPFPCIMELLGDVNLRSILGTPLLQVQVTRLACGGFVMAVWHNHVMADGPGLVQLLKAAGELSRGAPCPSLMPMWRRELLAARDPPRVSHVHREFDATEKPAESWNDSVLRSFFFLPGHLTALERHLPEDLRTSACTFNKLTACLWRCRSAALHLPPDESVRALCVSPARYRCPGLVPDGYYGNAFACQAAVSTAGDLCGSPLEYAVRLVKDATSEISEEYVRSAADLSALRRWPFLEASRGTIVVSDLRRAGFREVDWGWGESVFAGPPSTPDGIIFYIAHRDPRSGEEGILVLVRLPPAAMEEFAGEMESMTGVHNL